ncbi:L-glutamate gamma-semialdehyde dehydrogenase [Bacteroidia bacterium]|jgi:1-pyrroline-5-carboxylate dehydrogenase|nr:L-glutamate gamma-semialdehyde dehydrogenase [Bacteroidia bacterium]MDC0561022.1 L-glutamate gamma-semialdehyde dehydrogenase [Bacteroidia bacterium]
MNQIVKIPQAKNEPVKSYAPGDTETLNLKSKLQEMKNTPVDIPMYIGSKEIFTEEKISMHPPHEINHTLGTFNKGNASHVEAAISAALEAKESWAKMPWESRAAIFLRAADLLAGPYRDRMNAATMLAQSKNAMQAEIDAACEMIDFFKFNVQYMSEIYAQQPPENSPGVWNQLEYRPLEGFVFALSPFNFTSIAANLCSAPAMMGNTVVWKPAETQIYSAQVIMELYKEAGLPDGVINLVYVDGPTTGDVIFNHRDFAGIHFTGSTGVFRHIWKTIGNNIDKYRSYPRIVGETGGKDFVMVHASADINQVNTALVRGSFEFQGQKCSAASRAYIPQSMWTKLKPILVETTNSLKMGTTEDFSNFINAVIDQKSFDKISSYIDRVNESSEAEVIAGGSYDDSDGYFIRPTIIETTNPAYATMCDELFGPVLSIYVYPDDEYEKTLHLVDNTSEYALTGAIYAKGREHINTALDILRNSAGNFYINDKPTGAVVGQQPFGGARGSGTNDKAGAPINLMRWTSMRTIKETFVSPLSYEYPFHS